MFMWTTPVRLFPFRIIRIVGLVLLLQGQFVKMESSLTINQVNKEESLLRKLPILYDSSSIDAILQKQLLTSALMAFQSENVNGIDKEIETKALPIDLTTFEGNSFERYRECAHFLVSNKLEVAVSLLSGEEFEKFSEVYEELSKGDNEITLLVFSPRSHLEKSINRGSIALRSLQMSKEAETMAMINRVNKVGVNVLIPVLDENSQFQRDLLQTYQKTAGLDTKLSKIKFTSPILLNSGENGDTSQSETLKNVLEKAGDFHAGHMSSSLGFQSNPLIPSEKANPGILLLATNSSQLAIQIASEKEHILMSWFSPNIMDFHEWAFNTQKIENKTGQQVDSQDGNLSNNSSTSFGLYTIEFIGSFGWDNPHRRKMLRQLTEFTGPAPRVLSSVVAFDTVILAIAHLWGKLPLPILGLSGIFELNKMGFRKYGTYLGTTSISKSLLSSHVALLQPSTWIFEDITSIRETRLDNQLDIWEYDIATSTVLTRNELLHISNLTKEGAEGCKDHLMKVITYDPFKQIPYQYLFSENNLPETMIVPNHQGYGLIFLCTHHQKTNDSEEETVSEEVTTMQIACLPGMKLTQPISCFRSHLNRRQKRAAVAMPKEDAWKGSSVFPSVQYQYSLSGNDPLNMDQQHYYQTSGDRDYVAEPQVTYGYSTPRLDHPSAASEEPPPPPSPTPPGPKLPELRQIIKAAKPFVGSCIGSSTGCAICVLVLGRLPLGTAPTACTGPCFVGTFGSCGSLLGRIFAETTVICTELFRQGLIDPDTFVADAEFGKYMLESSPYTLQGYTLLATPLVSMMKSSSFVTSTVATFALPWAHHMKYLLGRSNETNTIGSLVHQIGYPLCNLTGRIYFTVLHLKIIFLSYIPLLLSLVYCLMTILLVLILIPNLSVGNHDKKWKSLQFFSIFIKKLMRKFKDVGRKTKIYFKAIGSRT